METISDNELSLLTTGNCSPPGAVVASLARELQRYRAAGPLPIELKPGQVWIDEAGAVKVIGIVLMDGELETFDVAPLFGESGYDSDKAWRVEDAIREGNYRLVAGPGAPKP